MEAWQKREFLQQQFVEMLARLVRDAAEESGNFTVFIADFCIALLRSIRADAGGGPCREKTEAESLRDDVLIEISKFTLIESEMTYLLGRLLEKLLVTVYAFAQRQYQSKCISDPKTAYGQEP